MVSTDDDDLMDKDPAAGEPNAKDKSSKTPPTEKGDTASGETKQPSHMPSEDQLQQMEENILDQVVNKTDK